MRVCVVIVNWNCWRDTLNAAASVKKHASHLAEVVVVDNASSDESVDLLRRSGLEVVRQDYNSGFAAACNVGALLGFSRGAEYAYLLNPDAVVTEGTIQALLETAQARQGPLALGSIIAYADDGRYQFIGSREDSVTGHPRWVDTLREQHVLVEPSYETDYIMGAALLFNAAAYTSAGPLPEEYFLYYEETAWCYAARRAGVDCRMVPGSRVLHKGSATVGKPEGPLQTYFCTRNELLFLRTFAGKAQLRARFRFYAWWVFKRNIKALYSKDGAPRTRAMTLGLIDFARGTFGDCPAEIRRLAARTA